MQGSLTIVTAYFRDDNDTKSFEMRCREFEFIAAIGMNICLFSDSNSRVQLIERFGCYQNIVFMEDFNEIRETQTHSLAMCIGLDTVAPDKDLKSSFVVRTIINAKPEFCSIAAQRNPWKSSHFLWLDFSVFYVTTNVRQTVCDLHDFQRFSQTNQKALYIARGCAPKDQTFTPENPELFAIYPRWRFLGGLFFGDSDSIVNFSTRSLEALTGIKRLSPENRVLPFEINVWAWMESIGTITPIDSQQTCCNSIMFRLPDSLAQHLNDGALETANTPLNLHPKLINEVELANRAFHIANWHTKRYVEHSRFPEMLLARNGIVISTENANIACSFYQQRAGLCLENDVETRWICAFNTGRLFAAAGLYSKAEDCFQAARELCPENPLTYCELATIARFCGKNSEAMQWIILARKCAMSTRQLLLDDESVLYSFHPSALDAEELIVAYYCGVREVRDAFIGVMRCDKRTMADKSLAWENFQHYETRLEGLVKTISVNIMSDEQQMKFNLTELNFVCENENQLLARLKFSENVNLFACFSLDFGNSKWSTNSPEKNCSFFTEQIQLVTLPVIFNSVDSWSSTWLAPSLQKSKHNFFQNEINTISGAKSWDECWVVARFGKQSNFFSILVFDAKSINLLRYSAPFRFSNSFSKGKKAGLTPEIHTCSSIVVLDKIIAFSYQTTNEINISRIEIFDRNVVENALKYNPSQTETQIKRDLKVTYESKTL